MRGRSTNRPRNEPVRIPYLSIALIIGVLLIIVNLATGGVLLQIDRAVDDLGLMDRWPELLIFADVIDRIGQRLVILPLLIIVAVLAARKIGSVRPLLLAVAGTLLQNFIVGVIKLATARESPRVGVPELFTGNLLFPSGHSSNVVFVYGLMAVLSVRYGLVKARRAPQFAAGVLGILLLMVATSVYRDTHWVTDLVAGGMIGGMVLELTLLADRHWHWLLRLVERIIGPVWVVAEWARHILRSVILGGWPIATVETERGEATVGDDRDPVPAARHERDDEPPAGGETTPGARDPVLGRRG